MNRLRLAYAAMLLMALLCITPAIAQVQPSGSDTVKTGNLQKMDDAKDEEARLEAEKRKQIERKKHQDADDAAGVKKEDDRKEQEQKDRDRKHEEDLRKQEEDKKHQEADQAAKMKEENDRKEQDRKHEEDVRKQEEDKKHQEADKAAAKLKEDSDRKEQDRRHEEDKRKQEEDRKHQEADKAAKAKEAEARLEASKRKQVERRQERDRAREERARQRDNVDYRVENQTQQETVIVVTPQNVDNGAIVVPPTVDDGATVYAGGSAGGTSSQNTAPSTSAPEPIHRYYRQPELRRSYASLLCAPGSGDRKTAVGLQYVTNKNYGVGIWFSGNPGNDDDVIQGTIPHNDYYTESQTTKIGVEALYAVGSEAAMLILGAGVSVDQTKFVDISNATGWKWDGGEATSVKPAAQIGCRLRVGGRVSLQFGYDTAQSAFFGLSGSF